MPGRVKVGAFGGVTSHRPTTSTAERPAVFYVWLTILVAALVAGLAAGFAFGCRLPELDSEAED